MSRVCRRSYKKIISRTIYRSNDGDAGQLRNDFFDQFENFSPEFSSKAGQSGDVCAGMRIASDKSAPDGIGAARHHNRDSTRSVLGGKGGNRALRDDDAHARPYQLVGEASQSIGLTLGPFEF